MLPLCLDYLRILDFVEEHKTLAHGQVLHAFCHALQAILKVSCKIPL